MDFWKGGVTSVKNALLLLVALMAIGSCEVEAQTARECGMLDRLRDRCGPTQEEINVRRLRALNSLTVIDQSTSVTVPSIGWGLQGRMIVRNDSREVLTSISVGWLIYSSDAEVSCPARVNMESMSTPYRRFDGGLPPGGQAQLDFVMMGRTQQVPDVYRYCLGPTSVTIDIY